MGVVNRKCVCMKKLEVLYREILHQAIEKRRFGFTQLGLAGKYSFSLSTVNHALKPLAELGAIEIKQRGFVVVDARKMLYYWATVRRFSRDVVYATRVEKPVRELERMVPSGAVFTCFSAHVFKFKEAPADYSEVYFYVPESELGEVRKRFPESKGPPNVFVLKADEWMGKGGVVLTPQLFVDLWNVKQWYAHEFVKSLERRLFDE